MEVEQELLGQGRHLSLLLIEDSEEDAELAVLALRREGYEVDWRRVDTEPELRALLAVWRPDIVLSDYSMPAWNGLAALDVLRELDPDLPFIFVSGTIGEEGAIEAIHRGATDYILKDNLRRLGMAVARAVHNARARSQALEIARERARLAAILEATPDLVMMARPDGSVIYLNEGGRDLLDLREGAALESLKDLNDDFAWHARAQEISVALATAGIWQGETVLCRRGGTSIPVSVVILSHASQEGDDGFLSFIARDLRERLSYEQQIHRLANYDGLTGLPNRALLEDRASQAFAVARRHHRFAALLVINIDRFKTVNDAFGRHVGDTLLVRFGERLLDNCAESDTVARLGGDSFAVLMQGLPDESALLPLVRRLRAALSEAIVIEGRRLIVSSGIGISLYPRDGDSFAALLEGADAALHRCKELGAAGFQFYASDMTRRAAERLRWENDLHQALQRDELRLYYQPQYDLATGRLVGVEALLRWQHPDHGMVPPGDFIPIAEQSELIHGLGDWVLRTACRQLCDWEGLAPPGLRMAVNISARQLGGKGFVERVASVLRSSGLPPRRIELELTESALLAEDRDPVALLQQLSEIGVQLALDDFGTGYSSLSYLTRLPLHCLKIDRSFVQRALQDEQDAEIVRTIVALGGSLRMRVVAEGIETQDQLALLRGLGCGEGQGYLLARPMPANECLRLFTEMGMEFHSEVNRQEFYNDKRAIE